MENIPRWPRSNYPNFNNKKFDYSRDANIEAYFKTADKLRIAVTKFGTDSISAQQTEDLIDKIVQANSIHEMTVYADVLWDAYNSYDATLSAIAGKFKEADKATVNKLTLLIKYLKLDTGLNRRPIVGKHFSEIDSDVSFYTELHTIAKELIVNYSV